MVGPRIRRIAGTGSAAGATRPRAVALGFTLLECIIAAALLAVAALVAFPTMLSFFELSESAREENLATHDLMAAVEDLLATPFSLLTTTYADGQPIPKYAALHLRDEQIVVSYANPGFDPLYITLAATWSDRQGRPRQETFRCVRTR